MARARPINVLPIPLPVSSNEEECADEMVSECASECVSEWVSVRACE